MSSGRAQLLAVLGMMLALAPLSIDAYLPALPVLGAQLHASPGETGRTLAAFFIGLSLGQGFYGPVSDRFGRKPPLYAGLALFTAASFGCALAPDVPTLVLLRFLQAVGGCAGMVVARAVVRDLFDHQDAARAFSRLMLIMGLAPVLAPALGSLILLRLDWRWIFHALGGFGLLCLAATWGVLRETHPGQAGALHPAQVLRTYLALARDREFRVHALASGLAWAGMFAYITASPFVFETLHGFSAVAYGVLFGCNAAGMIAVSQINARLLARHPAARLLGWGYALCAGAALALLAGQVLLPSRAWAMALPLAAYLASLGCIGPNAAAAALRGQGMRAGSAAALMGLLQFGLAALAGWAVAALEDGTARPMAGVIAGCALAALALHRADAPGPVARS